MTVYPQVKQEMIAAFCGARDSAEVSRALGYKFNQVKRWRDGAKDLRWTEFCALARHSGVNVEERLSEIFAQKIERGEAPPNIVRFLRQQIPGESVETLASQLNCHPSVLKRFLAGETNPDMEFVFRFLDLRANLLSVFVSKFVDLPSHPQLRAFFERDFARQWVESRYPLASAVEACLAIKAYRDLPEHSDVFVAKRVGASATEVKELLGRLVDYGNVRLVDGKYEITYETINMNGADMKLVCPIVRFWTERAADRFLGERPINRPGIPSALFYRIAPVTSAAIDKINLVMLRCAQEIQDILVNDETKAHEEVRVILMHHMAPNDIPDRHDV